MSLVKVEIDQHIALVTLSSPPVNAVSLDMMQELISAFDRISDLDEVRCAVLTGEGKMFSAGADIKSRAGQVPQPGDGWNRSRLARESSYCIVENKKPVIAAINGPALGAGWGIAASCDILYASENAFVGLPEIDVGLMGGARHSMRVLGHSLVRRMLLTGYRVSAAELYRRGVIEECLPQADLLPTVMKMAELVASKSPVASRLAKHALSTIEGMGLRDGYRFEQNMTAELVKTEDSKEAMRAFVEKRPPVFKGR